MKQCICDPGYLGASCTLVARQACFDQRRFCIQTAISGNGTTLHVQLIAATTEWLGLMIASEDGKMTGGDCWIGHVNDLSAQVSIRDYYSKSFVAPELDTSLGGVDSLTPLGGMQNTTHTVLQFSRPLATAVLDAELDHAITDQSEKITWAMAKGHSDQLSFHGETNRGVGKLNFVSGESKDVAARRSYVREVHAAGMLWRGRFALLRVLSLPRGQALLPNLLPGSSPGARSCSSSTEGCKSRLCCLRLSPLSS